MNVVINAISIKEGGSLVVLRNLLRQLSELDERVQWHVAASPRIRDAGEFALPRVTPHLFEESERTPLHLKWWYNHTLPGLLKQVDAGLLFSLTNYLPERTIRCPSLLLEQHAGHFSSLFDQRMRVTLSPVGLWLWRSKRRWVVRSLKRATRVTVQTAALADAIADGTGIDRGSIAVIPHGPGLASVTTGRARTWPTGRTWQLGYITKFGVQKNFEVLIGAVARLVQNGVDLCLHLTLDPTLPECQAILAEVDRAGIAHLTVNHGEIEAEQICDLYRQLDLFAFPSLCESFGFPLLEAMAHAIPLLVADIPSNREVAGPQAVLFDPFDADDLAAKIGELMARDRYVEASQQMLERSRHFSWERTARQYLEVMYALVERRSH